MRRVSVCTLINIRDGDCPKRQDNAMDELASADDMSKETFLSLVDRDVPLPGFLLTRRDKEVLRRFFDQI